MLDQVQIIIRNSPLMLPILIMLIVAPVGFVDVFYYHIVKFKLFKQPSSRKETVTHIMRSLVFGFGAFLLLKYEPHGYFFWIVGGLFLIDFVNTIIDVLLEPKSREPLGGIPPLEYLIHVIGAVSAGAITTAYFIQGWALQNMESGMSSRNQSLPWWILAPAVGMVVGSLALGVAEVVLLVRHGAPQRASAQLKI